jgi:hypothetical protein
MAVGFNPMNERVCHARSLMKKIFSANCFGKDGARWTRWIF